jgi:Glycosyl hydrolases family 35
MKLSILALFACLGLQVCASPVSGHGITERLRENKRAALQDIVTWDANSLFIYGQRVVIYSGEFHPFRLPVPSLWLDVFQKMRAMG